VEKGNSADESPQLQVCGLWLWLSGTDFLWLGSHSYTRRFARYVVDLLKGMPLKDTVHLLLSSKIVCPARLPHHSNVGWTTKKNERDTIGGWYLAHSVL